MKMIMKTSLNLLRCALSLLLLAVGGAASAATYNPPQLMSYQGYLTDESGNPLGSTNTGPKNYNVVFRVWNQQTGGTIGGTNELYAEQQTVTVANGYFSVLLGLGASVGAEPYTTRLATLFPSTLATPLFVEITVLGIGASGGNITILPRLQLNTSPYAFLAANAVNAANLVNAGSTNVLSINNNSLSIPNAGSSLTVNGSVSALSETLGGNLNVSGTIYANNLSSTNNVAAATATITTVNSTTVNSTTVNATTVNATTVNATTVNGYGTIPIGGIIMWSGATTAIPTGWALCNGQTVNSQTTPDLRDKFIVGAGNTYSVASTGGRTSATLIPQNLPQHTHTYKDGFYTDAFPASSVTIPSGGGADQSAAHVGSNGTDEDNTYIYWRQMTTDPAGYVNPEAVVLLPPYYALAYIMRVN